MSEKEFLENERRILNAMKERGKKARKTGLVSKLPKQREVQTGYIVYLTHSQDVVESISSYSRNLDCALTGRIIPYGEYFGNVHTTVGTYDIQTMPLDLPIPPQLETLYKLTNAAQEVISDLKRNSTFLFSDGPVLEYSGLVHDEGTVVAQPNDLGVEDFYELEESFEQKSSEEGIQLKKSWGRHITVARIAENIPPEELEEFKKFIDKKNSITSFPPEQPSLRPVSLNVGYFMLKNGKQEYERRFHLTPFSAFFF